MSRIISTLSIGLATALTLSACSGQDVASTPTPTVTQSVTASATPISTPTPEAIKTTTAPVETAPAPVETPQAPEISDVMPVALEKYKVMSVEEFSALPKDEQLTYWSWQSRHMQEFADRWHSVTNNPRDILVKASLDNSAQEIDAIAGYKIKFGFTIEDPIEQEKALHAILMGGDGSIAYSYWINKYKKTPATFDDIPLMAKNLFATTQDATFDGSRDEGGGYITQKVRSSEGLDGISEAKMYYVTFTNAQGGEESTWVRS